MSQNRTKNHVINHITPKNYNVISTYAGGHYYRYDWQPGNPVSNECALPNAPMAARHTLLAQMLRNGSYVNGIRNKAPENEPIRFHVKRTERLKGRLLGVEIEYYPRSGDGAYVNKLTDITSDGSLNSGGAEIRRLTWASKTGRLEGLLSLKLAGKIDKSCGLHVHVDARHLGGDSGLLSASLTYERLILLYPVLKKLVPKSRLRNRYCRWRNSAEYHDRYCAINFQSFRSHGTIEFRCQGGTINLLKIESWALLCQFLVQYCANPVNTVPTKWAQFLAILPEPLRSWCIFRREKLYGTCPVINERTMSAIAD